MILIAADAFANGNLGFNAYQCILRNCLDTISEVASGREVESVMRSVGTAIGKKVDDKEIKGNEQ